MRATFFARGKVMQENLKRPSGFASKSVLNLVRRGAMFSSSPLRNRRLWRVLYAGLLAFSLGTPVKAQTAPLDEGKVWRIRDDRDQETEIRVRDEQVALDWHVISVAHITQITLNTETKSIGWDVARGGLEMTMGLSPYPLGAGLLLAPFKRRKYFITIGWDGESGADTLTFRTSKGNYRAILDELTRVTGKPWRDAVAELKQQLHNAPAVRIVRPAEVDAVRLKPGRYRVVISKEESGMAEAALY